jgi:hypothetical protein
MSLLYHVAYADDFHRFGRASFNHGIKSYTKNVWKCSRFIAFDYPEFTQQTVKFEDRYAILIARIPAIHPLLFVVPRLTCNGKNHILNSLLYIIVCTT